MQKKIVLNQVTLCADGSIGVQWLKQIIEDDGSVIFSQPHRTSIDLDGDLDAQIDGVDRHLEAMGYPSSRNEWEGRIKAIDAVGRSDRAIQKRRSEVLQARAERAKLDTAETGTE